MSDEALNAHLDWLDKAQEQNMDYETWLEKQLALLEAENAALSELLSPLVDVELERDIAMSENQRLTKHVEDYEEEIEELETQLSLSISMYEGDRSPMNKLQIENATLKRENEKEHEQVCQFIRDMYTGRFAEREEYYWELPQWIRDAIEIDPIYKTAEEKEDERD